MDFNSSLPVRSEQNGDVVVKVVDGTLTNQTLTVNADGSVNVTDNGGSLTVDGVDFDIRDLDSATDSVEVLQATHDNLNANANLQVGNADVANGNPVPVSDAGGSLTVDATDLDIRDLSAATDNVAISDGTDTLAINNDGSINSVVTATDLDIRDLAFATDKVDVSGSEVSLDATTLAALESITVQNGPGAAAVNIQDGGNSITVDAADLDIRDLNHATDSVAIGDGTDLLDINVDGSINTNIRDANGTAFSISNPLPVVLSQDLPGTEVCSHEEENNVAGGASANHDYTPAAAFLLNQIECSGSGKMKVEVFVETGVATNTFTRKFVQFNSTAATNTSLVLKSPIHVATGVRIRVTLTNRDLLAQSLYSSILGQEG